MRVLEIGKCVRRKLNGAVPSLLSRITGHSAAEEGCNQTLDVVLRARDKRCVANYGAIPGFTVRVKLVELLLILWAPPVRPTGARWPLEQLRRRRGLGLDLESRHPRPKEIILF